MYLEKLVVQGIRNIDYAEMKLSPGVNLFYGLNGSGKTSLLEAIYLLSRGRSFRSRNLKTVISQKKEACTCFGLVNTQAGTEPIPIGVNRDINGKFIFKVSGEPVVTASKLAQVMPLQLIDSESFNLLVGPPVHRRSFVDWGVFHVEHNYRELWARFVRCLKHRNSILRHGRIDPLQLSVWDREFCSLSARIAEARKTYLAKLLPVVRHTISQLDAKLKVEFDFYPGWDCRPEDEKPAQTLAEQLQVNLPRDKKLGFTQLGPHRADLRITSGKSIASTLFSRGQTKLLVCGLKLAQGRLFNELAGNHCIYLLDDLPSELDKKNRMAVIEMLLDMRVQVMVTGVEKDVLIELLVQRRTLDNKSVAVFHVEHGVVSEGAA